MIVALRNEKGSYSGKAERMAGLFIEALRNEKGSYSTRRTPPAVEHIVAKGATALESYKPQPE